MKPLPTPGRSLSAADCIVRSVTTRCCRWRRTGGSSAAANSSAVTIEPWSEKEFQRLHTFAQIVAVVTEQIQNRVSNNVDYDLLCHERDNFRILVAITNAVLSRLDIDELVSEVAKEIHRYFRIDAISVVLRSDRKGKLNIYSTHYLDASHPVHDQSEVDEA